MTAAALHIWTLEDELEALFGGEARECLVCGETVEVDGGRVDCRSCGSVLEPGSEPEKRQLSLV